MKKFFKSLFTDKTWDFDISKLIGFVCVVAGFVGYFLEKDGYQWLIGTGVGLLGVAKFTEGV